MLYRAIGLMSGSSLDGLDIVFTEIEEVGGKWSYEIKEAECVPYSAGWQEKLQSAPQMSALDYQLLHSSYGHYLGEQVNAFINKYHLHYKIGLVASHGHTVFHVPAQKMTAQIGCGAALAATVKLPVVSDLRAMDVALGGQGAPIVPIAEKKLWSEYEYLLNIGGIANLSINQGSHYIAFDVCPANRVLNLLANEQGQAYDKGGAIASTGNMQADVLDRLNQLDYYQQPFPKSLANEFGTDTVFPLLKNASISIADALYTYVVHIAWQVKNAIQSNGDILPNAKLLVTGGGAHNEYLILQLKEILTELGIEVVVPDAATVDYKEAVAMALIGVLRWRQEANVMASVTGAERDSVGGALWMGQEE